MYLGLNQPYSLHGSPKKKLMWTQLIHGLMSLSPEKRFYLEPRRLCVNPEEIACLLQACLPSETKRVSCDPWRLLAALFSKHGSSLTKISSSESIRVKIWGSHFPGALHELLGFGEVLLRFCKWLINFRLERVYFKMILRWENTPDCVMHVTAHW